MKKIKQEIEITLCDLKLAANDDAVSKITIIKSAMETLIKSLMVIDGSLDESEFLFIKLLEYYNPTFKELPYDEMFGASAELYEDYLASEFNTDEMSEYECMGRYLSRDQVVNIEF